MGVRQEMLMAEAEEVLRESNLALPVAQMISFILNSAETGVIETDKLQDLAKEIRAHLDHNQILRKIYNGDDPNSTLNNK